MAAYAMDKLLAIRSGNVACAMQKATSEDEYQQLLEIMDAIKDAMGLPRMRVRTLREFVRASAVQSVQTKAPEQIQALHAVPKNEAEAKRQSSSLKFRYSEKVSY